MQCRRNMVWDRCSAVMGGAGTMRSHGAVYMSRGARVKDQAKGQESEIPHKPLTL